MSEILDALRAAREDQPVEALGLALLTWPEAAPPLLAQLEAYLDGRDRSEEAVNACFFILFLMAGARETRGFPLALRLARDAEAADTLMAEAATGILTKVFIGTYDGGLDPLLDLVRDPEADEFVRAAAIDSFCWLAATGAVPRPQAEAILRALFAELPQDDAGFVWDAWCQAVALLGFDSLRAEVHAVFERGLVEDGLLDVEQFEPMLAQGLATDEAGRPALLAEHGIVPVDDVLAALEPFRWVEPRDRLAGERWDGIDGPPPPLAPVTNPYRNVGRNDPCPCGSGRKFKKCCLGA